MPIGIQVSPEQIKKAKLDTYNQGYDGTANRPMAIGLGSGLAKCWDSGKEDKDAGKDKAPRCGPEPVGGRARRRKTKKVKGGRARSRKGSKTRRH